MPRGGKKATPEITVPQIRAGIASLLHEALAVHTAPAMTERLRRKALAHFHCYKKQNLLAPLRLTGT